MVYTSPAPVARATATILAEQLRLPGVEVRPGLQAGASYDERYDVWPVIEELRDAHPDDAQVVAVTDQASTYAAVCRALGLPAEARQRFRVDPASMSAIAFRQNRTILSLLNESCHLNGSGA